MPFIIPVPVDPKLQALSDFAKFAQQYREAERANRAQNKVEKKAQHKKNATLAIAGTAAAFTGGASLAALGASGATTTAAGGFNAMMGAMGGSTASFAAPAAPTLLGSLGVVGSEALRGFQGGALVGGGIAELVVDDNPNLIGATTAIVRGSQLLNAPRVKAEALERRKQEKLDNRAFQLERDAQQAERSIASRYGFSVAGFRDEAARRGIPPERLGYQMRVEDIESRQDYATEQERIRDLREAAQEQDRHERNLREQQDYVQSQREYEELSGAAKRAGLSTNQLISGAEFFHTDPSSLSDAIAQKREENKFNREFLRSTSAQIAAGGVFDFQKNVSQMGGLDFSNHSDGERKIRSYDKQIREMMGDKRFFKGGQWTDTGLPMVMDLSSRGNAQFQGIPPRPKKPTVESRINDGTLVINEGLGYAVALDADGGSTVSTFDKDETKQIQELTPGKKLILPDGRVIQSNEDGALRFYQLDEAGTQSRSPLRYADFSRTKKDAIEEIRRLNMGKPVELDAEGEEIERVASDPEVFSMMEKIRPGSTLGYRPDPPTRSPFRGRRGPMLDSIPQIPIQQQRAHLEKEMAAIAVKIKAGRATAADIQRGKEISRLLK